MLAFSGMALFAPGAAQAELVPFVPTPHRLVEKMLELAAIRSGDYLIDLGCGDGRIAIAAARRGARALGVDLDPLRLREAAAAARIAGVTSHVRFRRQDLFVTPIYDADVVALYLLPSINLQLRPRLLTELKPGARIVSHAFDMGQWHPDAHEEHDGRRIFLWIVPAIVAGHWQLIERGDVVTIEIDQIFQKVTVRATEGGRTGAASQASLVGDRLDFSIDGREGKRFYHARIEGDAMIPSDMGSVWQAHRVGQEAE